MLRRGRLAFAGMRPSGSHRDHGRTPADGDERRAAVLYVVAGVAYIALGVAVPELLLSWAEGVAFLLLAVWLIPAALRRLR